MRKRTVILLVATGVLLLAPIVFIGVLLYTQTGTRLLAGQLDRLERIGVHIEGLSGTIAGGLRVARFELDIPRVHVVSYDIAAQIAPGRLAFQTVHVTSLTARDTLVEVRSVAQTTPSTRAPRFLPSFLRIDTHGIDLTRVRYVNINGTTVDAQRVQGRVAISSHELDVREARIDATRFDATGGVRLLARQPLRLNGKVSGRVRPAGTPELAIEGAVDGDLDRLAMKATVRTPSVASIEAIYTHPDDRWRIDAHLASASFALDPWMERPPFSLRNVDLELEATADEIRAAGTLGVPELDNADLTVDVRGLFSASTLRISSAAVALNGSPARLKASGTATFDGGPPTLDVKTAWTDLQWPRTGQAVASSGSGTLHLHGPMPYSFELEGAVVGPQIPQAQGKASGVLSQENLAISDYSLAALQGTFTGAATLQFAAPRAWTLSTHATDIDPSGVNSAFPGRIGFNAQARGTGLDKKARFALAIDNLTGRLRNLPVSGNGAVERSNKGWRVRNTRLAFGDARLALDASLTDTIDARWSLTANALDALLPEANGRLNASGTATGPLKAPHVVAKLDGADLRYTEWTAKELSIDGDVDLAGKNASHLIVRGTSLGYGQPLVGKLSIDGDGNAAAHRLRIDMSGVTEDPTAKPPRAEIAADGRIESGTWLATVHTTHITTDTTQESLEIAEPAQVIVARDRASLDSLCLVVSKGRLCASGHWQQAGPWEGIVSGYEIPLATILPEPGEDANYEGRIEGRVRAFGTPGKPWEAEAGMRIIDAAVINRPQGADPEKLTLGNGGLAATATPERINFSLGLQAFADTFLYANAHIARNGSNDVLHLPLTGDVRARAADANLLPVFFPDVDHAAGLVTASADIRGTLASPEVTGRIELARGELDSYQVNLSLREAALVADITGTGLDFRGSARAGDGQLNVQGRFSWMDEVLRGNFSMKGENLLVADLSEYRVVASPDLTFSVEGQRMEVNGKVTIPSARIQPVELSGAVRASDDVRFVGDHPAERAGRFVVRSNVLVAMGDDVRIDTFGLQVRIAGGVTVASTTGGPTTGRGELKIIDGRYEAYGAKLGISRGRLLFEASPLDDPGLDIEARREIESVTVGMNVRGTLQEPRITFFSDPSMQQTEILSYLIVGKSTSSSQSSESATVNSTRDALAAQGGGLLASRLGRHIGLDEVGVESSTDSAGTSNQSLVLGKFLSPKLFVSYGISLTESINTLKVRYTIRNKLVLKSEAGEHQSADLEYTIERQ
jgi:translocation and assembly module TamB